MKNKENVSKIFPTPSFLGGNSLGVDISDKSVKYTSFSPENGELILHYYGKEDIPYGIVERGEIKDPAKLKEIFRKIKKKVKNEYIRAALPEEKLYLFNLSLPKMQNEEVRDAIALSLEQYVPITNVDVIFDFDFIEEKNGEMHFQVGVIPKDIIDSYLSLFEDTGFIPISFEIEAQSIARAVIPKTETGAVMMVDMGETRTGISIAYKGFVLFTSTIGIGSIHLDQAIMKYFDIDEKEAKSRKEKYGIRQGMSEESNLLPAVVDTLMALRDEVNKHYIFWSSHPFDNGLERPKIEKMIMCGGGSNLSGVVDFMSESLKMRVEKANPWVNVNSMKRYIPDMQRKDSMAYTTSFGLALADYDHD